MTMTAELITAIGAFLTGIAGVITAVLLHNKTIVLLTYRLGEVEKKLETHNGYGAKFAEVANDMATMRQDIAVIKTSLEFLKEEAHRGD